LRDLGHYLWRGWHRREIVFLLKIWLIQPLKFFSANLKYQLKYKYPPLAKDVTKGYCPVVTHVLYHFCDMSLITCNFQQYNLSCCLPGDTICLLTNWKMIKTATLIDLHIVLTYDCWYCFLVFNI
jgi:hypothetical protein